MNLWGFFLAIIVVLTQFEELNLSTFQLVGIQTAG